MGCAKLGEIIKNCRQKYPHVVKEFHANSNLEEFRGKRFFFDVPALMYKYVDKCESIENKDHLYGFLSLNKKMENAGIHACFVFDGKTPAAKRDELVKRKTQRQRTKERTVAKIANMVQKIQEIDSPTKPIEEPKTIDISPNVETPPFQQESKPEMNEEDAELQKFADMVKKSALISKIVEEEKRLERSVKPEYYVELRQLFLDNNISFIEANYEGEQAASWLVKNGFGDMVVSDDYDCLLCGSPVFFQHFQSTKLTPRVIYLEHLLRYLEFTFDQFVDYCTLLGTDFKGHLKNIGVKRAETIIRKYGSLDAFIKSPEGKSMMNKTEGLDEVQYAVTRKMFTDNTFPVTSIHIPNTEPFQNLIDRFNQEHSNISVAVFEHIIQSASAPIVPPSFEKREMEKHEMEDEKSTPGEEPVLKQSRLSLGKSHKRVIHL